MGCGQVCFEPGEPAGAGYFLPTHLFALLLGVFLADQKFGGVLAADPGRQFP